MAKVSRYVGPKDKKGGGKWSSLSVGPQKHAYAGVNQYSVGELGGHNLTSPGAIVRQLRGLAPLFQELLQGGRRFVFVGEPQCAALLYRAAVRTQQLSYTSSSASSVLSNYLLANLVYEEEYLNQRYTFELQEQLTRRLRRLLFYSRLGVYPAHRWYTTPLCRELLTVRRHLASVFSRRVAVTLLGQLFARRALEWGGARRRFIADGTDLRPTVILTFGAPLTVHFCGLLRRFGVLIVAFSAEDAVLRAADYRVIVSTVTPTQVFEVLGLVVPLLQPALGGSLDLTQNFRELALTLPEGGARRSLRRSKVLLA
jgi:hypothetical protein